jgi:hypothetical protein
MDALATAIVEGASLIKQIFISTSAEGNITSLDQETAVEMLSSVVQNFATFFTELLSAIAGKL